MTAADDDLLLNVASSLLAAETPSPHDASDADVALSIERARVAIAEVRRHDAAKVVPLRPRVLSVGWDDTQKAALHMPDGR